MTSIKWTGPDYMKTAKVEDYTMVVQDLGSAWWVDIYLDDHKLLLSTYNLPATFKSAKLRAIAAMEKHKKENEHIETKN